MADVADGAMTCSMAEAEHRMLFCHPPRVSAVCDCRPAVLSAADHEHAGLVAWAVRAGAVSAPHCAKL